MRLDIGDLGLESAEQTPSKPQISPTIHAIDHPLESRYSKNDVSICCLLTTTWSSTHQRTNIHHAPYRPLTGRSARAVAEIAGRTGNPVKNKNFKSPFSLSPFFFSSEDTTEPVGCQTR
ncbi:MAG: hypothetical protein MN733_34915, partial [Nitrososphaera sp.]|nr:hypothetical protein [Nitrososphaera sp.]